MRTTWDTRECTARFHLCGRPALRVKIKSLAAEAVIIRREAKKYRGDSMERGTLNTHRITVVRDEARSAQLAYAFLRGVRYRTVEQKCKRPPDVKRITAIADKFGQYGVETGVPQWLAE